MQSILHVIFFLLIYNMISVKFVQHDQRFVSFQKKFLFLKDEETVYKCVFISERELKFMFAICHRRSVCLSVCLSVVCL